MDGLVWTVGLTVEIKLRFRDGLVWTVGLIVEIKLRFRDGLVWTVGLTVEIKLRFRDGLVWTVGLTVEIKLRFRDGLVWTVGLTVEIKLRFSDGLVWTVGLTVEIKLRFQISLKWRGRGLGANSTWLGANSIKFSRSEGELGGGELVMGRNRYKSLALMYIEEEIVNIPKCFSEEGCLCAARENIPILKKSYKMTFLLHANSTCIAASSLIFVAEWPRCVPLFDAFLFSLALLSLIFTNPFSVFPPKTT